MGKKQNIGFDDFLNFILELHFHITKSLAALEVYFYDTYKFQIKDWQKLEIYLSIQSITSEAFTKLKELLYQDLANISLLRTSKEAIEKILNGLDYENVRDYGKKMSFDECYLDFQGIVDDLYNNYDCSEDSLANNIYHDSHYASLKYYEASRYGIRGLIILIDDIYNLKPHFKTEDIEYWRKIKGFVLPNLVEIQEFEEEYDVDLNKYRVRFQDFHGKPAIWEEEYNPHNEYNPHEEREFESEGTYDESTKDYELKDGGICPFGIHKAKLINFFNDSYETLELIFRIDNKRYSFSANWYEDADTDEPPNNYELIHWLYDAFGNPTKRKGNSLEELLVSLDINGSVGNTYLIKTYYGFSGNQIDYDFYPKLCDNEFEDDSFDYEGDSFTSSSNDITDIDNSIYEECIESGDFMLPENVKTIGDHEFLGCSLTSITIPNSVTSIGEDAFMECTGLTSITIPNSVTSIGEGAFLGCSSLTSITIPNSVTSIGEDAFYGCSSLTSIIVDEGNLVYDSRGNCNAIIETSTNTLIIGCQSTVIPDSVISIDNYAFSGCSSLTSIIIPNVVTSIGVCSFEDCTNLTSVIIPDSVKIIEFGTFRGCSSLTSITIPNSVTTIGDNAFEECSSLTSITIPNGVTTIGDNAFEECSSLTSITIPNSVTTIGCNTFFNCDNLETVFYTGNDEQYASLDETPSNAIIYYYSDSFPKENGNYWHYVNGVATIWK